MSYKKINGYIYLRDNVWFKSENVYKLGITSSLLNREDTYRTGEPVGGFYALMIDIGLCNLYRLRMIEKILAHYLHIYHRYHNGGGHEFYDRCIINHILSILMERGIAFKIMQEIDIKNRIKYEKQQKYKNLLQRIFHQWSCLYHNSLKPFHFQKDVLDNVPFWFQNHNILKLIWPCGLGKALFSIFVIKKMRFKTILIGVPSINLQKQMKDEILRIFPLKNNILCIGNIETTSKVDIQNFLFCNQTNDPIFIITTYHSCHLFLDFDFIFDIKIGDEAHHLVGTVDNKFCLFHQIKSIKTLYMTATEKTIEKNLLSDKTIYSMDNEDIFGYCIDRKSVKWAIENKKITDYNILVLKNTEEEIDSIIQTNKFLINNKDLFLSCFMCLKAMEKYETLTHLLLYTNTIENSLLAKNYIDTILSTKSLSSINPLFFYNNSLNSHHNITNIEYEKKKFKDSQRGIISCVYMFGEGCDMPELNGVCVADNMHSEIRIVQFMLRPNRLDQKNPNKISFIILPYIDTDEWDKENESFKKIRNVVSEMRNLDETIEQKLRLCIVQKTISPTIPFNNNISFDKDIVNQQTTIILNENTSILEKLKLRLRYSKTLKSKNFQDEYQYIRSFNKNLGITSVKEYILSKSNNPLYIDNPDIYFKNKGVWNGWKDFLAIDVSIFFSWDQWIQFCSKYHITTIDEYEEYCQKNILLPKAPELVYVGFTNLLTELNKIHFDKRRNL